MNNSQIIEILENIAELLEIKGENVFKSRSYLNAARSIKFLTEEVDSLAVHDRLGEIPGVGKAIAKKLHELVTTGHMDYYEKLKAEFPPGINTLLNIRGIGPRTASRLINELNIQSADDLEQAIIRGRLTGIPHLGEKSLQNILNEIQSTRKKP